LPPKLSRISKLYQGSSWCIWVNLENFPNYKSIVVHIFYFHLKKCS
jgi:hypothetical protein